MNSTYTLTITVEDNMPGRSRAAAAAAALDLLTSGMSRLHEHGLTVTATQVAEVVR